MENNYDYSEEEIMEMKKEIARLMVQNMSPQVAMQMLKFAEKMKNKNNINEEGI